MIRDFHRQNHVLISMSLMRNPVFISTSSLRNCASISTSILSSSRKYPYLPHGKDFFQDLPAPPLWIFQLPLNKMFYINGLLTKPETCQDGWTLAKFFFYMFMDWDRVKVHKLAKTNEVNIQPSWPTSLVNKWFIIWLSGNFLLWDTAGSPKWAR